MAEALQATGSVKPGRQEPASERTRKPTTPSGVVGLIKALRMKHPEYSKYKLSVILRRDHSLEVSPSTIGRVISRYQLFRPKTPKRRRRQSRQSLPKVIKPRGLEATKAGQIYEFDVKHYAFVAVDTFSRQTFIMVSTSISSKQAALAWEGVIKRLGVPDIVITDWVQRTMVNSPSAYRPALRLTSSPESANLKTRLS